MANYYNGREAFYCWNSSYYCTQPFGIEGTGTTGTVQLMAGSVTSTLSPEISQMMMTASPSPAQFSSNEAMMISPGYFVSAPFSLLSTMVTLNPGTFQPQPYIQEETQFQNTFQTLQIRDRVTSQCTPAPVFLSSHPLAYQPPPTEFQFFPSRGNTLFVDMTVPTMTDQGTQWVLLPLSEWASAPVQVQQQVLREMFKSRYATGPSLYSQMKVLAAAGKLRRRGKPCGFCVSNKETDFFARSHVLRDHSGIVRCPVLRRVICKVCHATGDNAHTAQYCPLKRNNGEGGASGSGDGKKRSRYARNSAGKQYVRKY